MKTPNIFALNGSILAISAFVSANPACAQRKTDFELQNQTMFDWYVATPDDRRGTAYNIVGEVFMPKSQQDYAKFVRAADALIECVDRHLSGPDGEPVAKFVKVCMALVAARGLLE